MAAQTFTQQILFYGTQASYNAATKSDSGLYFTTDTHKLYKGSVDFSAAARVVTALPTSGNAANSVVYVLTDNSGNFLKASVTADAGATWKDIALKQVTSFDETADNSAVPTAKAVVDYVASQVGSDGVVAAIAASTTTEGDLDVTDGAGTTTSITVPGVVTTPTWNSTTRVLTLPVTEIGSTAAHTVTVDIGKDMVVTDGEYHAATEEIWLWLSTHPKADYPTDPSIKIPVGALVDELEVADTETVDLTYTTATNTLSANVKISGKSGNALQVLTSQATASEDGLYISLAAYALNSDLEALAARVSTAEGDIDSLETRMGTAEGDIDALETRMGTAEGNISDNATSITNLYTAMTTWAQIS